MFADYNFVRAAAVVPKTRVADPLFNIGEIINAAGTAASEGADIIVFPELAITSYTCADLFRQKMLLKSSLDALKSFLVFSNTVSSVIVLGIPLQMEGKLFNCAAVLQNGKVLGVVPKTYIPNNNEFYEARWFASSRESGVETIELFGKTVPFKPQIIFKSVCSREFSFSVEICEDLWAVIPPGSMHALAGAELILNISSSNELAGKSLYRRNLVKAQSASALCGYVYTSSGIGESTTDTVYGGHSLIAENGKLLAENRRFLTDTSILYADIDLDIIRHERMNNISYSRIFPGLKKDSYSVLKLAADTNTGDNASILIRNVEPRPFIPDNEINRRERCEEILTIQSTGLATRLAHTGINSVVIGLSGGLDSTLAFLVTVEAFAKLKLDLSGIHLITMPGFGTTVRTRGNVEKLCNAMGLSLERISIVDASARHLEDIGHDGTTTDITYENSQARERTQILMDKANLLGALVIGTGDLSELALGWCTYNGDHMSMYAVNSGVPKTLVSYLIRYYKEERASREVARILEDIIATPISPELLPPDKEGRILQKTEDKVGPYELHDFYLYNVVRFALDPLKILFLAETAFGSKYSRDTLKKWLKEFYRRFFSQQFKRSAIPDGPKVGTIALSPRADWRMPSDASVSLWLEELEKG